MSIKNWPAPGLRGSTAGAAGMPSGFGMLGVLDDDGERVLCHECGRRYRALTTHLVRTHGLDPGQYRDVHGLARTLPLAAAATRQVQREQGVARRDRDPRVLAVLHGAPAAAARAAAFPERPPREQTAARRVAAKREAAAEHWRGALAHAGWVSWEQAGRWAVREGVGWAAVAARMGTAHTATKRAGTSAGVDLGEAWVSAQSREMLAVAEAHVAAHGSLRGTRGALSRWVASRRYIAAHGRRGWIEERLDRLDPGWAAPRGSSPGAGGTSQT